MLGAGGAPANRAALGLGGLGLPQQRRAPRKRVGRRHRLEVAVRPRTDHHHRAKVVIVPNSCPSGPLPLTARGMGRKWSA